MAGQSSIQPDIPYRGALESKQREQDAAQPGQITLPSGTVPIAVTHIPTTAGAQPTAPAGSGWARAAAVGKWTAVILTVLSTLGIILSATKVIDESLLKPSIVGAAVGVGGAAAFQYAQSAELRIKAAEARAAAAEATASDMIALRVAEANVGRWRAAHYQAHQDYQRTSSSIGQVQWPQLPSPQGVPTKSTAVLSQELVQQKADWQKAVRSIPSLAEQFEQIESTIRKGGDGQKEIAGLAQQEYAYPHEYYRAEVGEMLDRIAASVAEEPRRYEAYLQAAHKALPHLPVEEQAHLWEQITAAENHLAILQPPGAVPAPPNRAPIAHSSRQQVEQTPAESAVSEVQARRQWEQASSALDQARRQFLEAMNTPAAVKNAGLTWPNADELYRMSPDQVDKHIAEFPEGLIYGKVQNDNLDVRTKLGAIPGLLRSYRSHLLQAQIVLDRVGKVLFDPERLKAMQDAMAKEVGISMGAPKG